MTHRSIFVRDTIRYAITLQPTVRCLTLDHIERSILFWEKIVSSLFFFSFFFSFRMSQSDDVEITLFVVKKERQPRFLTTKLLCISHSFPFPYCVTNPTFSAQFFASFHSRGIAKSFVSALIELDFSDMIKPREECQSLQSGSRKFQSHCNDRRSDVR